jgi:DNA (cytosine-5)-methyltransferase 1
LPRPAGPRLTLEDAIGHLPSLESGQRSGLRWHYAARHAAAHVALMRQTPTGEAAARGRGFSNCYRRMRWNEPAPCLISGSHMVSSSNTVHPGRHLGGGLYSDARTLSVLEALLVMGLPEDWPLPEDLTYREAISVLGEGICPRVVEALVRNVPREVA